MVRNDFQCAKFQCAKVWSNGIQTVEECPLMVNRPQNSVSLLILFWCKYLHWFIIQWSIISCVILLLKSIRMSWRNGAEICASIADQTANSRYNTRVCALTLFFITMKLWTWHHQILVTVFLSWTMRMHKVYSIFFSAATGVFCKAFKWGMTKGLIALE